MRHINSDCGRETCRPPAASRAANSGAAIRSGCGMAGVAAPGRRAAALLAATAAGFLSLPAAAQELTIWDWKSGDPALYDYYELAEEVFAGAYPDAEPGFVMQPHDQYYTILGTALASGSGPDLILLHGGAQTKERTEALLPLDDHIGAFMPQLRGWEEFTGDDGAAYAIPLSIQGFVVYANLERYEEAGLAPDALPTSWEELVAACEAITAADAVPCFALGNKEGFAAEFFFSVIAASSFTAEDHEAWAAGTLTWSSPKVMEIIETWVATQEMGWYNEGANSTAKFMDEYEMFMRGDAANTIGLISDVAHWKQFEEFLGPENLGVFIHPAPTLAEGIDGPRMPYSGGIGYAVNAASPNAELAVELAVTLASTGPMQVFFNDAGVIPSNTAVDTSALESPTAKTILGWMGSQGAGMAHVNMSTEELEEWHRQSQLLLNGETTVEEAAARLDEVQAAAKG